MKKAIALSILATSMIALVGCSPKKQTISKPIVEKTVYFQSGRYYLNGNIITNDGNIWGYTQDIISEAPAYDNEPVYVGLNDNGTPNIIEDDEVVGLVLDRETAIYDELEKAFAEDSAFTVKREGNNITIGINK